VTALSATPGTQTPVRPAPRRGGERMMPAVGVRSAEILDKGYTVVADFLHGEQLSAAQTEFRAYFPAFEEARRTSAEGQSFRHARPFPFPGRDLNGLAVHPWVIEVAGSILGGSQLRLTSSFVQAKYGTGLGPSRDQQLHNDAWSANSLLFPRTDGPYQRLYGILYLSDVTEDLAPTYVVGRAADLGVPLLTAARQGTYSRDDYGALYAQERPVLVRSGSLLLFLGDVVHRGSAMTAEAGERDALFFNFHDAVAGWTGTHLWGMRPSSPEWPAFSSFIEQASVAQRNVLGFPPPGDPYWTSDTLAMITDLYPDLDCAPYREAGAEAQCSRRGS
jgi:ectoine hydroxylase-related dioxygenase (phytanoyl-CoA dioxygenase family)